MDLWRECLPGRARRRAARAMRRLRQAVGPAGEAFASQQLLREGFPWSGPAERAIALEIERHAGRRREECEKRASEVCTRRRGGRLRELYRDVWGDGEVCWEPRPEDCEEAARRVASRDAIARQALRMGSALGTNEALHAARVAVKRWRYVADAMAPLLPADDGGTRGWLKSVQRALGHISDLGLLRAEVLRWARKHGAANAGPWKPEDLRPLLDFLDAERARHVDDFRWLLTASPSLLGADPEPPGGDAGAGRPH